MLIKVFKLLVDSLFFHSKAFVVFEFDLSPLTLNFVNQFLVVGVNLLDVFDPPNLHLIIQVISLRHELFSLARNDI